MPVGFLIGAGLRNVVEPADAGPMWERRRTGVAPPSGNGRPDMSSSLPSLSRGPAPRGALGTRGDPGTARVSRRSASTAPRSGRCRRSSRGAGPPCGRPSWRRRAPPRRRPGRDTALPAASRITSPVCRPFWAAAPSGSTSATTTPAAAGARHRGGRRERQAEARQLGLVILRLRDLGLGLLLVRQRAERDVDGLLVALVPDRQRRPSCPGPRPAILRDSSLRAVDGIAVHGRDRRHPT